MRQRPSVDSQPAVVSALTAFAQRMGSTPWDYRVSPRLIGLRWVHRDHYDTLWEYTFHPQSLRNQARILLGLLRDAPEAGWCPQPAPPWWWKPLALTTAPTTVQAITQAFRLAVRQTHPDAGGSATAFTQVVAAREAAVTWLATQTARSVGPQSSR